MAKAVINLQKESGGIVKISPVDGVGITEVTVPESGLLAKTSDINTAGIELKTIATGTATFTTTTNNINLTGIGVGVEIGDVIKISGSTNNNMEFTIEVITDNNNIIVNQAHANNSLTYSNGKRTKTLASETSNITVKLLAKYYNASPGLGQDWVTVTASRAQLTNYPNNTKRSILATVTVTSASALQLALNGERFSYDVGASGNSLTATMEINANEIYSVFAPSGIYNWRERR